MPTTFLRFLGWMVPGDFSTIDVSAQAQAGPERPVDLMLVIDRSGSMGEVDGTGKTKIEALKCAMTGLGCSPSTGFLGENFTPDDQLGMTSFGKRGCGTGGTGEFTGNVCVPNKVLGSTISSIVSAIDGLGLSGTTNTMEGLRTGKTEIAKAIADPTRNVARKVVLLVTDGQPTALRLDSITACEKDPLTGALPGGPSWTDANGCFFVKRGNSTSKSVSDGLDQFFLNTNSGGNFNPGGSPAQLYLHQMQAARNAARDEANAIRNLGGANVIIFTIGIGEPTNADATARLDANSRCLLAQIANDETAIEDPSTDTASGSCAAVYAVNDGDNHGDLKLTTPAGTPATFNPNQQKGKFFTVDLKGDVQAQLQQIFNEIAALLKLRLVR
jgi:von Willebrand factor type A domain-containing protein